jgi:hypothetical protein
MRDGEVGKLKIENGGSARLSDDESEATLDTCVVRSSMRYDSDAMTAIVTRQTDGRRLSVSVFSTAEVGANPAIECD